VVQRVSRAEVRVGAETVARIGRGLCLLVGVGQGDDASLASKLAAKVWNLRILPDNQGGGGPTGMMERSLAQAGGEVLVVSQFTLYGDTSRGRRPSWTQAAPAEEAKSMVDSFCHELRALGASVQVGRFGAHMEVELVNDGPVTILLEETKQDPESMSA